MDSMKSDFIQNAQSLSLISPLIWRKCCYSLVLSFHIPQKRQDGWMAYYLHDMINLTCRNGWGTPGWGKLQHLCQIRFWSEDLLRWLIEDHKHVLVHSLGFFDPRNVHKKHRKMLLNMFLPNEKLCQRHPLWVPTQTHWPCQPSGCWAETRLPGL